MDRGPRPDYGDRNITERLRCFDRDKRLDGVHELEGEPWRPHRSCQRDRETFRFDDFYDPPPRFGR